MEQCRRQWTNTSSVDEEVIISISPALSFLFSGSHNSSSSNQDHVRGAASTGIVKGMDPPAVFSQRPGRLLHVVRNGVGIPVYPTYQWSNSASYSLSSFDSVMTQISAGDPDKLRYKIDYFTFTLEECDRHLSRYYSSVRGYLDEYSVRLDEPVFTNVTGGIGIFGSYRSTSAEYFVNLGYARLFGYQ
jgi:hypothetical protein